MIRILECGMGKKNNPGGIESYLINQYRCIYDKCQVDYLKCVDGEMAYEDEILKHSKIYSIPERKYHYIKFYIELIVLAFHVRGKYDCFVFNTGSLSQAFPLVFACLAGIDKRIIHAHAQSDEIDVNIFRKIMYAVNRPIVSLFATEYWACSEEAGRWLFHGKNYRIINNAIDSKKFSYNESVRRKMRKELNLENNFVIGHIGRFSPIKNHMFLLKVFDKIHSVDKTSVLLLIGDYKNSKTSAYTESVMAAIKKHNLSDCVRIIDFTYNINEYYQAMDVFVLPSIKEGLPLVTIEAQAASLPCVVSEGVPKGADVIPELITHISLDNMSNWVDKILGLRNRKQRFERYREIVAGGFDVHYESENIIKYLISR